MTLDDAPALVASGIRQHLAVVEASGRELGPAIEAFAELLVQTLERGGTVLTLGNGGSAADAQHLAAELIGRFRAERPPFAAMSLATDPSVVTCIANDYGYEEAFARQVRAFAKPGDLVIGFSTSGDSASVVAALEAGRAAGATTVALTGEGGGSAAAVADLLVAVPSRVTARVQEVHTLITHLVSERIDAWALDPPDTAGER